MFKYFLIIILFFVSSIQSQTLTKKDKDLYLKIFDQFRSGNFADGEINIAKLDNDILLGHVEALKLLHPTKHRSSFLELKIGSKNIMIIMNQKEYTNLEFEECLKVEKVQKNQ